MDTCAHFIEWLWTAIRNPQWWLAVGGGVAAWKAILEYRRSIRERIAERFITLEQLFAKLSDITRLVDPNMDQYNKKLGPAVRKSFTDPPTPTTKDEHALLVRLDQFLRFLLLVSSLKKFALIETKALAYMYGYWFLAVIENKDLKEYVQKYFTNLDRFLEDYRSELAASREVGPIGSAAKPKNGTT